VRRRDRQPAVAAAGDFESVAAQLVHGARQDFRLVVKLLSGRSQGDAVGRPDEQVRADPTLKSADPPAEGRLGDVTRLGRP
jgi:hypothetical protein